MAIQYSDTIKHNVFPTAYAVITGYNGAGLYISFNVYIYTNAASYAAGDSSISDDYFNDVLESAITLTGGIIAGLYAYMLTQPRYTGGSIV